MFLKVLAWVVVTGLGVGLAAFVGRQGKALSRRHRNRTKLPVVSSLLGLLLAWGIAAISLTVYYSAWYLVPLGLALLVLLGTIARNPVEEDVELLLQKERQKQLAGHQKLVDKYEALLADLPAGTRQFVDEAQLPAPRNTLAHALRMVYWARLTELDAGFTRRELIQRYAALAHFLPKDDAAFMNESIGLVREKEEAMSFARQDPEYFILLRERMNRIYKRVDDEQGRLMAEWYKAAAYFDED